MIDMICDQCGQHGIRWEGWQADNFTHTKCPHCGGVNTHRVVDEEEDVT